MPAAGDFVSRASHVLMTAWTDAALKGSVVLVGVLLLRFVCRRSAAAFRHLLWLLGFVGLAVLPVLSSLLPGWDAIRVTPGVDAGRPLPALLLAMREPTSAISTEQSIPMARTQDSRLLERLAVPSELSQPPVARGWTGESTLVILWLLGGIVVLLPMGGGMLSLWLLRRQATPVRDGLAPTILQELAGRLGLRRPVRLLQSTRRSMPMTWGAWRPILLLPAEAVSWPPPRLRLVLIHELTHIRRWDCLTQTAVHLLRALYWPNPLVWLAVRRLRTEQERSCDDAVLNAGTDPADYAESLLVITCSLPRRVWVTSVALAMSSSRAIERRVRAILDGSRPRQSPSGYVTGLAAVGFTALLLPLASAHSLVLIGSTPVIDPAIQAASQAPTEQEKTIAQRLVEVQATLQQHSAKPLDDNKVLDAAIRGMLGILNDPAAEYIPEARFAGIRGEVSGRVSGVGAQLRLRDGRVTVVTPLENSPALKAGLRPGDVIEAVDEQPTQGRQLAEVVRAILGPAGTAVKLKVLHANGKEEEVRLTRAAVQLRSVQGFQREANGLWSFLLDPDHQIGYVHITMFGPTTAREIRQALTALQRQGLKGLVLHLRFCPGGVFNVAAEVVQLFLARGTIVSVERNSKIEQVYKAEGKAMLADLPLVVLINAETASAAEVVAGALKDNGRAILLGTRSFGKGSVQSVVKLPGEAGALRLTMAYFLLPSGRHINKQPGATRWGVDPDDGYYVPMDSRALEALHQAQGAREILGGARDEAAQREKITPDLLRTKYADPQLAAAVQTLIARLTSGAFVRVGKSDSGMQAQLDQLRQRRAALLKSIEHLNEEMKHLEGEGKKDQ
jgi:carboxyl-terminal processing protease